MRSGLIPAALLGVVILLTSGTGHAAGLPAADSASLVVNEVAPEGPGGELDEFLELRNLGDRPVNIGGWRLYACQAPGPPTLVLTLPAGTVISGIGGPGQYLLLAGEDYRGRDFSGPQTPDLWLDVDIPADGGWRIADMSGKPVDGFGLRDGSACTEHTPAAACDWSDHKSGSRNRELPDGDNNREDFSCRAATPTNSLG
ncbi:MAG: lamin tail domain-containing protein [Stackebrandtia sp.]